MSKDNTSFEFKTPNFPHGHPTFLESEDQFGFYPHCDTCKFTYVIQKTVMQSREYKERLKAQEFKAAPLTLKQRLTNWWRSR